MVFQECKELYDKYIRCLENKKIMLNEKKKEYDEAYSAYSEASSIFLSAKEETENALNELNNYTEKKVNKIGKILNYFLGAASILAEFIVLFSSKYGYLYALLSAPIIIMINGLIYVPYAFIKDRNPQFFNIFWKKDNNFKKLYEIVDTKQKELVIVETNKNNAYVKTTACEKQIKILEGNISYIENDIKELMLSFAPILFGKEVYVDDNNQEKPYTKIRRK